MKLKYILYSGLALGALTACNDFLDVDAPSSYTDEFVYSQKSEIQRALNGVYAQALVNDLYGNAFQRTFVFNSDVDFQVNSNSAHSHTGYSRFDCDDQGGDINKYWTATYNLIEYANRFVVGVENSDIYDTSDRELMQWLGEAKCLRAMAYHDLVVLFGDVPFTFQRAADKGTNFVVPVFNRQDIQDSLIQDLGTIAPYMSSTSTTTVERCSREFAHSLIARIALTAGGYSLHPDKSNPKNTGTMQRPDNYKDYYQTAMTYADSVILAGTHRLGLSYQDVFVNECNYQVVNNDDPIFEIPFARESTGNTGYLQGPTYSDYEGMTVGPWGKCDGSVRLNAFYRFLFRDKDLRREFVNGLWYYSYFTNADGVLEDSVYIRNDYSVHCNKWSKLWTATGNALGQDKSGSTGINFPYMRYADVLLMYAEAANELNDGPTDKAVDCLQQVHRRAFANGDAAFITAASASKDAFEKAVLDERKWEFAGENIRWRDLVRTNRYAEEIVYCFLRYYSAAMQNAGSSTGYEDAINEHDGYDLSSGYIDNLPERIYYHTWGGDASRDSITPLGYMVCGPQMYGYQVQGNSGIVSKYPNQSMKSLRILNAYKPATQPTTGQITGFGFKAAAWNYADFYQWGNADTGLPKDQCKNSFNGYTLCDDNGSLWILENGTRVSFPATIDPAKLPAVRYILPYPNTAILRSAGAYKNYYGY